MLRAIAIRVWPTPSVVLNCSVQRLGAIGNIVSEPARVENYRLLNRSGRLMRFAEMSVFAERGFQSSVDFRGDVRLQAYALGKVIVRMVRRCRPLFVEFAVKLVSAWRKR